MTITGVVLAAALAALPAGLGAQQHDGQQEPAGDSKSITLRGCVVPGLDKGTYVLTQVTELPQAGRSAIPATAHGKRVVFWLDKDAELLKYANAAVRVSGEITDVEESEIEVKNGDRRDGGLVAEFEGPGKDVRVPNEAVAEAIGTSGRAASETDDIPTLLMKVKVHDVTAVDYSCRYQQ